MIGVIIPVHNEENYLHTCLESIEIALHFARARNKAARAVVILDNCSDNSLFIAKQYSPEIIEINANNVGIARRTGVDYLLNAGAQWLASTDADTCVSPDWLMAQIDLKVDVVCGTVGVRHWPARLEKVQRKFQSLYSDNEGHRHIHGANLGVSAEAYELAGGFPPLSTGEDIALIKELLSLDVHIAWSAKPRVFTSARRYARCRGGFADYLLMLEHSLPGLLLIE